MLPIIGVGSGPGTFRFFQCPYGIRMNQYARAVTIPSKIKVNMLLINVTSTTQMALLGLIELNYIMNFVYLIRIESIHGTKQQKSKKYLTSSKKVDPLQSHRKADSKTIKISKNKCGVPAKSGIKDGS